LSEHFPFRHYVVAELLAWDKWPDGDFRERVSAAILKGFAGAGFVEKSSMKRLSQRRSGQSDQLCLLILEVRRCHPGIGEGVNASLVLIGTAVRKEYVALLLCCFSEDSK